VTRSRLLVLVAIALLVAAFFAFGGHRYLTLEQAREQQAALQEYYASHRWQTVAIYFFAYVAVAGLSLPGAAVLTLVGGAVFGLLWGTLIVSFASSLGATLAFLASRFLLRDWVQARFGDRLHAVNAGMAKDGPLYLFALRLVPAFPFFAVNLLMGLTAIRAWTYYWVSQLGMFCGTVAFVWAGTELREFRLTPGLVLAFTTLAVLPFLLRGALNAYKSRRVYARWQRPAKFDRNLVVIGAGSAGLVSAYIAAAVKAKVTLVEKHRMGGDCLYTGCVPSKALIKTARVLSTIRRAKEYGLKSASAQFDFAEVMERVQRVVKQIAPHDSVERYESLGVECVHGEAMIASPWIVEIQRQDGSKTTLTTRSIVIAAGGRPFVPPIPGIEQTGYYTSDTLWDLRVLPRRLVVLGGGPIGCELAQTFQRLGAQVTQVEMLPRLLTREDPEIAELVAQRFREEGVDLRLAHQAKAFRVEDGRKVLICERQGRDLAIEFDALLVAVGRVANTAGYGLEALGIPVGPGRTVQTNEYLQTNYPNIYACGDVAGPYQFTHTASHQAWYAAVNALLGGLWRKRADYSVIPWATFTDPEVARVGLNETEAKEQGIAHEITTYGIGDLDRAIADEEAHGVVKVLTVPGKDRILGVTIAGEHAGDLIAEFVAAMRHGIGLNKILGTIHIYPTLAEANKYAAGVWKKAHAPQRLLRHVARFHAWLRG
jgi:pyruvate/2-oxoglutarate dehydrogenase complex dihydrolipoamide dehydrogenase (E3) component/uncharacterized membrane protein YdjX (TVP38/TMEM64 family)